jgi:NTE family protein
MSFSAKNVFVKIFLFLRYLFLPLIWLLPAFSQTTIIVTPHFEEESAKTREIVPFRQLKRPKVALVLSGGGARGVAHIGVLEALERHHIPIDLIVGTSMGSIVGGLYAMGYSTEQLKAVVDTTDWQNVLSLNDEVNRNNLFVEQKETNDKNLLTIHFQGLSPVIPSSISSGQRLTNFINQLALQGIYHPDPSFDDLKIPFRSIATDLISGKRIVMSGGDISEAMRASIAIPLLYSPMKKDTLELTDGGLVSNIPVDVALKMKMDIIIVVDVTSPLRRANQINAPWEMADQIIGIMSQLADKQSLAKATIVIRPDLHDHLATDFTNLDSLISEGEEAAEEMIPAIEDSIHRRQSEKFYSSDSSGRMFNFTSVTFNEDSLPPEEKDAFYSLEHQPGVSLGTIREQVSRLYATGNYSDVYAKVRENDSVASLEVTTYPNPVVRSVQITGNSAVPTDDLMPFFAPLVNASINAKKEHEAVEDLLALYRDKGYSLARVQSAEFDSLSGSLQIVIDEGIIRHVSIEGTTKTRDWVIWRELTFEPGDIFTVDNAVESIANLNATNLFDQVLLEIRYNDGQPGIVIKVTEKNSETAQIGIRIDNERNVQPSVNLREGNFLGTATELEASFAGGLRNLHYEGEIKANRIFNSYYEFNLEPYYDLRDIYTYENDPSVMNPNRFSRLQIGEYKRIKYGLAFSLGKQVERLGDVAAEYRVESDRIKSTSGTGYTSGAFTLQTLRLSSTVDTQDRFPFPASGSLMNMYWETATSRVGGDIGYSKIYFSYEWFDSFFGRLTFHPKVVFGFGDQTLPLTQQFSLGGENSFYGLLEDDSYGRQIFVTNLAIRVLLPIRLIWDTYFRARYDFGSIWPEQTDIRWKDLHHGIGLGIAIDTPVGPATFSIGRSFYIRRDLLNNPLTLGPIVEYFSLGYEL